MLVTQVVPFTKNRKKIYLDGTYAFALYAGELSTYHIVEGEELSEETYETILQEVLIKRAKLRAMNLLQKRTYTTAQLRTKLTEGGYPECVTQEALAYVAGFHYTDDLQYAIDYITYHEDTKSRRRIEQDLMGKGIDRDTLAQAFVSWEEQGGTQDEVEQIRTLLVKKRYDVDAVRENPAEARRIYAFLARKGFAAEEIRRAMQLG